MSGSERRLFWKIWWNLNQAVELGGFAQWLSEGGGKNAQSLLIGIKGLLADVVDADDVPRATKAIERVLSELIKHDLVAPENARIDVVACHTCGGYEQLEDSSPCPTCSGEGLVGQSVMSRHSHWLGKVSDTYLKLSKKQRYDEVQAAIFQ